MLERIRRGQTHRSRSRTSASGCFKQGDTQRKWHPNHLCSSPDEGMTGNKGRNKHDRGTSEWSEGEKEIISLRGEMDACPFPTIQKKYDCPTNSD